MVMTSMSENDGRPLDQESKELDFAENAVRRVFVRKVYTILLIHLLLSYGICKAFTWDAASHHMVNHVIVASAYFAFMLLVFLFIWENAQPYSIHRKYPMTYLTLFSLAETYIVAVLFSSLHEWKVVFNVLAITALFLFVSIVLSFRTTWDFTKCLPALLVIYCIWIPSIACIIVSSPNARRNALQIIVTYILSAYVMTFITGLTQKMLNKKYMYSISPKEYVFAALSLYLEIISIFNLIIHWSFEFLGLSMNFIICSKYCI